MSVVHLKPYIEVKNSSECEKKPGRLELKVRRRVQMAASRSIEKRMLFVEVRIRTFFHSVNNVWSAC